MGLALYAAVFYILVGVFAPMALRTLRWKVVTVAFVATFALFATGQVTHSPVFALVYTVAVAALAAVASLLAQIGYASGTKDFRILFGRCPGSFNRLGLAASL